MVSKHFKHCAALLATTVLFSGTLLPKDAHSCSSTTPCTIEGGEYFIAKPDAATGDTPSIFFIHGFGSSGEGIFKNTGIVKAVLSRGYALIAPSGMKMENRNGRSWSFHPNGRKKRDEIAFINAVKQDAIKNHGIDGDKALLAGFSIGGSMTSYLACAAPESFKAYAPVGGSFWRPHPTTCKGPVKLLHTHGWTDGTVPLEGRFLGAPAKDAVGSVAQGDVFHAMQIWRETNDCVHMKADRFVTKGPFWRRIWDRCAPDSALELALFPGGHIIPPGWADIAIDWFEAR